MPAKKKPFRKLADVPPVATHFTREEAERAVRIVMEEDRRAAQARRLRTAARKIPALPQSEA